MDFSQIGNIIALVGAVMVSLVCGLGSARAVQLVGEAAAGVVTEDSDKFGQVLLLQALPGTQGIYGLLTAFVLLNKIGMVGGDPVQLTQAQGWLFFAATIPMTVVGYVSAILQAKTAIAGIAIVAKRSEDVAKGITFAAMVETYAVLALLVSILMIFGIAV
jgi:V/A-type H+-transporting ATPase subunit K